jgi:hypothetical protein
VLQRLFNPSQLVHSEVFNLLNFARTHLACNKHKVEVDFDWRLVYNFIHSLFYSNEANALYHVANFYGRETVLEILGQVMLKLKLKFRPGRTKEIWDFFSEMINPNAEISLYAICMLGMLLPVDSNTTHDEINMWLVPLMGLWESRPVNGVLFKVMVFLLSQVAKYHRDFDFGPHMSFIYREVFNWVKGKIPEQQSDISTVIPGAMSK